MVTRRTFLIASAGIVAAHAGAANSLSGQAERRQPEPSMVAWAQPVSRQARPLRVPSRGNPSRWDVAPSISRQQGYSPQ